MSNRGTLIWHLGCLWENNHLDILDIRVYVCVCESRLVKLNWIYSRPFNLQFLRDNAVPPSGIRVDLRVGGEGQSYAITSITSCQVKCPHGIWFVTTQAHKSSSSSSSITQSQCGAQMQWLIGLVVRWPESNWGVVLLAWDRSINRGQLLAADCFVSFFGNDESPATRGAVS